MNIKKLVLGAAVAGLGSLLILQRNEINRLRAAFSELKQTPPSVELLPTDQRATDRLQAEHNELMRLRAQAAAFRDGQQELKNARQQISQLKSGRTETEPRSTKLAEGMKGVADFRNLGHASAPECFETALWATTSGDTNLLAQLITFDEESRARAEHLFTNAPAIIQNRFANVDQVVAYMMCKTTRVVGMRVYEEEPISPGVIRLQTERQFADGRLQPDSFSFLQANDGAWQMLFEVGMVNKLGQMMDEEAAAMRAKNPM